MPDSDAAAIPDAAERSATKRRAALASVLASVLLTVAKLVVGLLTGSVAIVGEGVHSLLDVGATAITYAALTVSDKGPDDNHPYGHGKIESMAALAETALLALTAAGIVWESGRRLLEGGGAVEVTWWSLGVVVGAIVIDVNRVIMLNRLAKRTNSPALAADATHFTADIVSSSVVLIGLGFVLDGYGRADAIAGIGVAAFVALAAFRLGWSTIAGLIDTAPEGVAEEVSAIARRTPGVVEIGRARARPTGAGIQADIEIGINRRLTLDATEALREAVRADIVQAMPGAEISVSTFPVALDDETVRERLLLLAADLGLSVHSVSVQRESKRLILGYHTEVPEDAPLDEARTITRRLDVAIRAELGADTEIYAHLDPLMADELNSHPVTVETVRDVCAAIDRLATTEGADTVDGVNVRETAAGLIVSYRCRFAGTRAVRGVRESIHRIEAGLRRDWPVYRVVAHPEPSRHAER